MPNYDRYAAPFRAPRPLRVGEKRIIEETGGRDERSGFYTRVDVTDEVATLRADLAEAHRLVGEAQHRVELHRQTMDREREQHEQSRAALRADVERERDRWTMLSARLIDAEAEVERMRPVVEAAKRVASHYLTLSGLDPIEEALEHAVDAYHVAQQEACDHDWREAGPNGWEKCATCGVRGKDGDPIG